MTEKQPDSTSDDDAAAATQRRLGGWKGRVWIADDFDAPLPDDLLDAFEGRDIPDSEGSDEAAEKD